jgi:mRNA interferase HigB
VVIVTHSHILEAAKQHPDAAAELGDWVDVVESVRWKTFVELRATFPAADAVDGYVIFNVRGNWYRLITVVHYSKQHGGLETKGHVYIRSFLTHKQYDNRSNWDRRFGR